MIVGVHPLAGFDKLLHYKVPEGLRSATAVGSLVRVPVGRTLCLGVVGVVGPPADFPVDKLKLVAEVIYPFPALTRDLLQLARWMAGYYATPMDTVIETMIPAAVRHGARVKERTFISLARKLTVEEQAALIKRAPSQHRLYAFLEKQLKAHPRELVLSRTKTSASSARALVERGVVKETVTRVERHAYSDELSHSELVASQPHALNAEQGVAVASLEKTLITRRFGVTLLPVSYTHLTLPTNREV